MEYQLHELGIGNLRLGPGGDDLPPHGHPPHPLQVYPPAVVVDLQEDVAPLLVGLERHPADRVLPRRPSLRGRLDAVVDTVADEVHQRVLQTLQDPLVELGSRRRP